MKIWIDLTNSPQVNFFVPMIRDLEREHELLLTSRPLANTLDLIEMEGFSHHVVGRHYGRRKIMKAAGFLIRAYQLYAFLKGRKIDVAISHSSFLSPVISRLLGIRSIYLNDNEHAAGNMIAFRFADCIMVPEFLEPAKVERQGGAPAKTISYPGVKEGIYLWQYRNGVKESRASGDVAKEKVIYVRPEPWAAQYYKGQRNFIDSLLIDLKENFRVILLPRGSTQAIYYRQERFAGITVPEGSLSLPDIIASCDLFIGAGGSMTREAAVLGVPTISIYQDELLDVDRFLISRECMVHEPNPTAPFVVDFLKKTEKRMPQDEILRKGQEAYMLIKSVLLRERAR
jgi:predicted glycosyltransferase